MNQEDYDVKRKGEQKHISTVNVLPTYMAGRLQATYGTPMSSEDGSKVFPCPAESSKVIGQIVDAVNEGRLYSLESMLVSQAIALQSMFVNLAERAHDAKNADHIRMLTALALKAQAQSRNTIDSIVNLKYPRQVAFVKQANIAQNQQINQGTLHAQEKMASTKTELLEQSHEQQWMDTGAKAEAARSDSALEAVAAINRAEN